MSRDITGSFRIASDPGTDANSLYDLSLHECEVVRGAVASNSSTPEVAIARLTYDRSEHVRECIRSRSAFEKLSIISTPRTSKTWH